MNRKTTSSVVGSLLVFVLALGNAFDSCLLADGNPQRPSSGGVVTHPFHVSVAEIEYNSKTKEFEIGIGFWAADMEKQLRETTAKPVDIEKLAKRTPEKLDKSLLGYVNEEFQILDGKGRQLKLKWVGHELDEREIWVYFTASSKSVATEAAAVSCLVNNELLFEISEQQVNFMNIKIGKERFNLASNLDNSRLRIAPSKSAKD